MAAPERGAPGCSRRTDRPGPGAGASRITAGRGPRNRCGCSGLRGFAASDLQVREAAYSYLELEAWYEQAWPRALGVEGAVYSDIAEGTNHLRFGALDAAGVANVTAAVLAAGVPSEAFVVVETAAIEQLHTLRDKVRPVDGGYQINFFDLASPGVRTLSLVCTLGFNVVKDGVNSFITNSHCTNHQGGTEDTKYYQPLMDDGDRLVQEANVIGIEAEDPAYDAISCATDFLPAPSAASATHRARGTWRESHSKSAASHAPPRATRTRRGTRTTIESRCSTWTRETRSSSSMPSRSGACWARRRTRSAARLAGRSVR
jgi:hypothetical protein